MSNTKRQSRLRRTRAPRAHMKILGVTRPRVSDVMNKKTVKFTIDALVDMLARTGKHVQLSVS